MPMLPPVVVPQMTQMAMPKLESPMQTQQHHQQQLPEMADPDQMLFDNIGVTPDEALLVLRTYIQAGKLTHNDVMTTVVGIRQQNGELNQLMAMKTDHKPARAHKHPDAPKRFKSPYICFFSAKQDEVRQKLGPEAKFQDHGKEIGRMWRDLGDDERAFWIEQSRLDRERFEREKEVYAGPWTVDSQKSAKRRLEMSKTPQGIAIPQMAAVKQPVPKGHKTAYILFFSAHQQQVKDEMAGQ